MCLFTGSFIGLCLYENHSFAGCLWNNLSEPVLTSSLHVIYFRFGHHLRVRWDRRQDFERGPRPIRGRHHRTTRPDRPLHIHRGPINQTNPSYLYVYYDVITNQNQTPDRRFTSNSFLQKVNILTTPKIGTVKNHQVTCHCIQHSN